MFRPVLVSRVTPLVAYLNSHQRTWLANQLFMEAAEKNIADPDWDAYMKDKVCGGGGSWALSWCLEPLYCSDMFCFTEM
jgi:hypothetical protein